VLQAKAAVLEQMPPFLAGGDMIERVTRERSTWNELPWKFEAGTMPIAEVVGLGAAVDYLQDLGMGALADHEQALVGYALERLGAVPGLSILGPTSGPRAGLVAFTLDGVHAHDVATVLDQRGVAVRAGHHCAMPLHRKLGIAASVRASFHCYTIEEEIDALVDGLRKVREVFGR
jgi:cysteine desulfurase / selenocysteine lyase